jgi:hypothetical protein
MTLPGAAFAGARLPALALAWEHASHHTKVAAMRMAPPRPTT